MSALMQELPRAATRPCLLCGQPGSHVNVWSRKSDRTSRFEILCAGHAADEQEEARVATAEGTRSHLAYDTYLPILLATLGDEMCIALECWTRRLGEQVRIMAAAVQP